MAGQERALNAARRFWTERILRQRRILAVGAALLGLLLCWLLLVEPALDGRAYWRQRLPALRAERAQMQALAQQASAAPPPRTVPPPDRPSLERSLAGAGLKPQALTVADALVRVKLADVSFSALADWLQQSQRDARLAVTEATVNARERIDRVDATLALRRP